MLFVKKTALRAIRREGANPGNGFPLVLDELLGGSLQSRIMSCPGWPQDTGPFRLSSSTCPGSARRQVETAASKWPARTLSESLSLVPPHFLFETHRLPALHRLSAYLREAQIRHFFESWDSAVVLFIWHPRYSNLLGEFGEAVSCYYVDEEFTSYYGMPESEKQQIRAQEESICEASIWSSQW